MSKRTKANDIVMRHVLWSLGGGLIPLPILDFAAVTAIQVDMLNQLSTLYDIKYDTSTGKRLVVALTGTTFAKLGSSFVKLIPGFGTVLGGVSMSLLSGASTYAVGQVVIEHFESGGDLFDIDMEAAKKVYKDAFEEGKEVAENLQKEQKKAPAKTQEDVFEALEKLGALRDKGILTEEEFGSKKAELLKKLV